MPQNNFSRRLAELTKFGSNPGALRGWLYLPTIMAPRTPLVVALHGCTQTAAGYDHGTGWTALAEKKGFAVLFPEQVRANNQNLCFNWFEPADARRDGGEALSIKQMTGHVVQSHGLDADRVFVTGLSAGGAMANVMLATYPEMFAGGAIIGGLPFGVSLGVAQAFERMHGRNPPDAKALRSALADASRHSGPWPRISIWHGTHDQTVKPVNAHQIASQWRLALGVGETPDREQTINGHGRSAWLDSAGNEVLEVYLIKGMAHGVPLSTGAEEPLGHAGPFMLDAGVSSTARIARSWGLIEDDEIAKAEGAVLEQPGHQFATQGIDAIVEKAMGYANSKFKSNGGKEKPGVGKVINDALRAAGLLRH